MSDIETYVSEHGAGIAVGMILGVAIIIVFIIVIAFGNRKPPE